MQTEPSPPLPRRLTAVACLVVLIGGCTPGTEPAPPVETATADSVLQSRAALGQPVVELAEMLIELADSLAAARYDARRGTAMQQALDGLGDEVDAVRGAADAAAEAAEDAPVAAAAQIVLAAAERAVAAVDATRKETAYLKAVSRIDMQLLEMAQLWDQPGSQSEIRSRLDTAAADVSRLRRRARALAPVPGSCPVMKGNRVDWATTVRTRTRRLQSQANSAGGGAFDELRAAYRRLPLGVEPRSADQRERACWRERSTVWGAAQDLRAAVESLESALQ